MPYPGEGGPDHYPEGLRYYEDIVLRDLEAYRRAWRDVRFGQLNAELAVQNHVMARINLDKFRSLRRLYGGLRVLTILAGGLLAMLALSMLVLPAGLGDAPSAATLRRERRPGAAGPAGPGLGQPAAVPAAGVREASGHRLAPRARPLLRRRRPRVARRDRALGRRGRDAPGEGQPGGRDGPRPERARSSCSRRRRESSWCGIPASASETGALPPRRRRRSSAASPPTGTRASRGSSSAPEAGRPGGRRLPPRPPEQARAPRDPGLRSRGAAPRTLGAADVVSRHPLKPYDDLTAVTWSERLGRLLVIAESADRLLVVSPDGAIDADEALPGGQQEGLALGPDGALWVADERQGLLRFPGAEDALAAALAAETGSGRARPMRAALARGPRGVGSRGERRAARRRRRSPSRRPAGR